MALAPATAVGGGPSEHRERGGGAGAQGSLRADEGSPRRSMHRSPVLSLLLPAMAGAAVLRTLNREIALKTREL